MLRLMLNCHPKIAVPHETAFITVFLNRCSEYGPLTDPRNASRLLDDIANYHLVVRGGHIKSKKAVLSHEIRSFADLVRAIMAEHARAEGKTRWGDKTPFYTPDIDVLWNLFPGCQFIHLIRDGRDVALSQSGISWLPSNVPQIAADWRHKTTICHKVGSVLPPGHFLEIRYEDLVTQPRRCARGDMQLPRRALFGRYALVPRHGRAGRASGKPEVAPQFGAAPGSGKIGRWKQELSRTDRILFDQIAGETLEQFGYTRERLPSSFASRLRNAVYFGLKR